MRVMEMREGWGLDYIVPGTRPDPGPPGPGEVLIRFEAASLNYRDLVMAQHGYGRMGALPFIPLSDGAGRVVAIGARVSRVAVGDLVCPIFLQGWISGALRESYRGGTMGGDIDGVVRDFGIFPEAGLVRRRAVRAAIRQAGGRDGDHHLVERREARAREGYGRRYRH